MSKNVVIDSSKPGPTFCWCCMGGLSAYKAGGHAFALVRSASGAEHRVHMGGCLSTVLKDGATLLGKTKGGATALPPIRTY